MQSNLKVLNFNKAARKYENYNNLITETINNLLKYADDIFLQAINLAMKKAYLEWDNSQPVGSQFYISDKMLWECGDEKVIALMELHNSIFETVAELGS